MVNKGPGVLIAIVAGSVLAYDAVKGKGFASSVQALLAGHSIAGISQTNPIDTPDATEAVAASTVATDTAGPALADASTPAAANQALGRMLATPYGWGSGTNWNALVELWDRESGWSNVANNASSGAYGIAQALPSTKYPLAGQPPAQGGSSSATAQIQWGLAYIQQRYGTPSAAWAHEEANGWY